MAEKRWNEVHGQETHHVVSFHTFFESLPRQLDIAIVTTTADVRPDIVSKIANLVDVRFWVLEKLLAQNESGLDDILAHTRNSVGAWVNTPRRMMTWHQQIKAQLSLHQPMAFRIEGGLWGMLCNTVHFLDLFAWWSGESLQDVYTDRLDTHWFESKRPGNWEALGILEARFSGGSHALVTARKGESLVTLTAEDGHLLWAINEADGVAKRSDGLQIPGRLALQSEMSASLVESILERGVCDLPTLEESVALHRVFIRNMLEHWKQTMNHDATSVPIT